MAAARAVVELATAGVAVLGCAISLSGVRSTVAAGPVADGQPVTTSVVYDPPLLLLALLLAAAAGVLGVAGIAGLRRARRSHASPPQ
jgi:hypothetical protein